MCARGHNGGGQSTRAHKLLKTELGDSCLDVLSSIRGEQCTGNINPATFDSISTALKCNSIPLVVIPLCGNLVVHGNGMYKLCDKCARVMRVCDQFRNTCFWCMKSKEEDMLSTLCCVICSKGVSPSSNDTWLFSSEFDDHIVSRRPVCCTCFAVCNVKSVVFSIRSRCASCTSPSSFEKNSAYVIPEESASCLVNERLCMKSSL